MGRYGLSVCGSGYGDRWWDFVNTVMNHGFLEKAGNVLTSYYLLK
jgi:hypothetical protein